MRKTAFLSAALLALVILLAPGSAYAAGATKITDLIWANGELYGTVITSASFTAPPDQTTDNLYVFDPTIGELIGQSLVSESAPGDTDYNGGRWSVTLAAYTPASIGAHGDGGGNVLTELKSEDEVLMHVDHDHIELTPTSIYFECPLIPQR